MNTAISQDVCTYTYRQLQAELRTFGTDVMVKLNASYQVLLAEYQRLTALFVTNEEVEVIEVAEAVEVIEEEVKEETETECLDISDDFSSINNDDDFSWSDMQILLAEDDGITGTLNEIDVKTAYIADHFKYAENYSLLSIVEQKKLLNALNYYLTAYGAKDYQLADSIISVNYRHETNLWQIKYFSKNNAIIKHETLYDSELINCLVQTNHIEVFEPVEELMDMVFGLREEFSGVGVITQGTKFIITFRSLALTFITRNNQLIYCAKQWDCGNSWVNHEMGDIYCNHHQVKGLFNQIRSDFWFEMEVLAIA
jgi:hypothetical protein